MSRNSKNRDIYAAKAANASNGSASEYMQALTDSPFRSHRKMAARVLERAKQFTERMAAGREQKEQT